MRTSRTSFLLHLFDTEIRLRSSCYSRSGLASTNALTSSNYFAFTQSWIHNRSLSNAEIIGLIYHLPNRASCALFSVNQSSCRYFSSKIQHARTLSVSLHPTSPIPASSPRVRQSSPSQAGTSLARQSKYISAALLSKFRPFPVFHSFNNVTVPQLPLQLLNLVLHFHLVSLIHQSCRPHVRYLRSSASFLQLRSHGHLILTSRSPGARFLPR